MKTMVAAILLSIPFLASAPVLAKNQGTADEHKYDFYQVSIQATHCKVKVLVNGRPNEDLAMDATHGGAVSWPMYQKDLKPNNTITLELEATDAQTTASLNVVGVTSARETFSTGDPGNVVALELTAEKIAASKSKQFSARFKASLRPATPKVAVELVSEEEGREYAKYLSNLLRHKDKEKLLDELLPFARRKSEDNELSEAELRRRISGEMAGFLDGKVFLEDKGLPIEVQANASATRTTYELGVKHGGLLQFYEKADPEKKPHNIIVAIEKLKGKIQIVDFGTQ